MVARSSYVFERYSFTVSQCVKYAHYAYDLVAAMKQPRRFRQVTVRGETVGDPHNIASQPEPLMQDETPGYGPGRLGGEIRRYWTCRGRVRRVGVRHRRHCCTHVRQPQCIGRETVPLRSSLYPGKMTVGTVVWTAPTGHTYRTVPAGVDLFPALGRLACATPKLPTPALAPSSAPAASRGTQAQPTSAQAFAFKGTPAAAACAWATTRVNPKNYRRTGCPPSRPRNRSPTPTVLGGPTARVGPEVRIGAAAEVRVGSGQQDEIALGFATA